MDVEKIASVQRAEKDGFAESVEEAKFGVLLCTRRDSSHSNNRVENSSIVSLERFYLNSAELGADRGKREIEILIWHSETARQRNPCGNDEFVTSWESW